MRVFISYSTQDVAFVRWIAAQIRCHTQVDFWDESKVLGERAWDTIYGWIEQSDLVIAIITDNTVRRAMAVGNEIGYAKKANKTIIPLVTPNVPPSELGCLSDITYERITTSNMGTVLQAVQRVILAKKQQKENNAALAVIALIVTAVLWGGSE